jgi:hypothetical protein
MSRVDFFYQATICHFLSGDNLYTFIFSDHLEGCMLRYFFGLKDGSGLTFDDEGVSLCSAKHVHDYARKVIGELMFRREHQTRTWRLDVYEDGTGLVFTIPFASVDHTLDHLAPALRATVERRCEVCRQLTEAIQAARAGLREARALVARSRGKPYLAAHLGQAIIRPELAGAVASG